MKNLEKMLNDDFIYFYHIISDDDFRKVKKIRGIPNDIFCIIGFTAVLFIFHFLNGVFEFETFTKVIFPLTFIFIIFGRCVHLFYYGRISALAYGIVIDKQSKAKVLTGHMVHTVYAWDEDDYKFGQELPIGATVDEFYYVNASICNTNKYLEHICCYKKDFDSIRKGTKVIIVKLNSGFIIAIPTA